MAEDASRELSADVVIVGAGVAGALVAHRLAAAGASVVILEAGPRVERWRYVENYRNNPAKDDNQLPYPLAQTAPHPEYDAYAGLSPAFMVGEDEDWLVKGRVLAPPAPPWIVAPGAAPRGTELAPTHHLGADIRIRLRHHRVADVLVAALETGALPPRLQANQPIVKSLASLAERLLLALVRACNVAVQRGRYVDTYLAHLGSGPP